MRQLNFYSQRVSLVCDAVRSSNYTSCYSCRFLITQTSLLAGPTANERSVGFSRIVLFNCALIPDALRRSIAVRLSEKTNLSAAPRDIAEVAKGDVKRSGIFRVLEKFRESELE